MNQDSPVNKLLHITKAIWKAPRRRILSSSDWGEDVPECGGVYIIWDTDTSKDIPVYIGETCHLKHRLGDLSQKTRHTFRHKIANLPKFANANGKVISRAISKKYKLSFLPISFGRKEVEEFLMYICKDTIKFNKTPRRLALSVSYSKHYPRVRKLDIDAIISN